MKVAITGASGYLGAQLTRRLAEEPAIDRVAAFDARPLPFEHPKVEFLRGDVRDGSVAKAVAGCEVAVHLAFIVQEIRDKRLTWDINVNGSRRVIDACVEAKVRKLVVASSIAAYGPPPPGRSLDESAPLRGGGRSYYSETKRAVEAMLDEVERAHPERVISRVRPSIICGAALPPFFSLLVRGRTIVYVKGGDALPLVHEDDVVEVFRRLVLEDHRGAFNVDAGLLPWTELAQIFQRRARPLPYWVARAVSAVGYRLGLLPSSEHWVELARYPVAIDTTRARTELGWRPTRTPAEAAREMFDAGQRRRAA